VLKNSLLSMWDEPAVADPPIRVWRDWALVAVLVPSAVLEGTLSPDVVWRPVALVLAVVLVFPLLWRRTHPLAVTLVVFVSISVVDFFAPSTPQHQFGLITMVYVLLLPYALCRWGSGAAMVIGIGLTLGTHITREVVHWNMGDLLVGIPILLVPAMLGLAVRYRATSRTRQVDQYRLQEREQLARELHDTVAHHVSAIAIQAQAARVVAASRPEAAQDALRAIESEASLALAEMRTMVGALRAGGGADLDPQRGVADIEQLALGRGAIDRIDVEIAGNVSDLSPSVDAAVYRLVQESITNAVRHAHHATRIDVRVVADDTHVRLSVTDDGDPVSSGRNPWGYGLVGMRERATLLGGSLDAGPSAVRGWQVVAALPKTGPTR
jgi:signal transduction histidine kinase